MSSDSGKIEELLNQAPCAMGLFPDDPSDLNIYLNDACLRMTGYTRSEYEKLQTSRWGKLMLPLDFTAAEKIRQGFRNADHLSQNYRIVRKDGSVCSVRMTASMIAEDQDKRILACFTDISRETALTRQFHLLADEAKTGIFMIEIHENSRKLLYANSVFYQWTGLTDESFRKDPEGALQTAVSAEDRILIQQAVQNACMQKRESSADFALNSSDSEPRYIHARFSAYQMEGDGNILLSVMQDQSFQKKIQNRLEQEEKRREFLADQVHAAVFEWNDAAGTYENSSSLEPYVLSGVNSEKALKDLSVLDCVHPDDLHVLQELFSSLPQQDSAHECVVRLKMKDGSYRWSEVFARLSDAGRKASSHILGFVMDINDETEKSIMMNELTYMIPGRIGIFKADSSAIQCLYLSTPKSESELLSSETLQKEINTAGTVFQALLPFDRKLFRESVREKAEKGEKINCILRVHKNLNPENSEIVWVHLSAVRIREENGSNVYYAILSEPSQEGQHFREITEHSLLSEAAVEYPSGKILYANQAFRLMIGVSENMDLGEYTCFGIMKDFNSADLHRIMDQVSQGRSGTYSTISLTGKYMQILALPIDWNGKNAQLLYFSDQTKDQKISSQLSRVISSMPTGIGIYEIQNQEIVQLYLNDTFHRMLNDTRENRKKFTGKNFLKAIHPDDIPAFRQVIQSLIKGKKDVELTYRVINGEKEYVWFHLNGHMEALGGNRYIYCCFFNIDQEMRTQIALKKEQTVLKIAMQAAKMTSWEYDLQHHCIYQDDASRKVHGFGRQINDVPESLIHSGYVHPDSTAEYRQLFLPVEKETQTRRQDVCIQNADRSGYRWERIIMIPLFDRNGRHVRSLGTSIDITEQKKSEALYHEQMQELGAAASPDLIAKGLYNLTRNRKEYYQELTANAVPKSKINTYDSGMSSTADCFYRKAEAQKFEQMFRRSAVMKGYQAGCSKVSYEYQRKASNGVIFWAKTEGRLFAEPISRDIMCFIYSYNINEHRMAQEMIHTVVAQDYDYFLLINCREDSYTLYAVNPDNQDMMPPASSDQYNKTIEEYERKYNADENQDELIEKLQISYIAARLKRRSRYTVWTSMKAKDGSIHRKKLQYSYLDRGSGQVLLTRMDVTDVYRQEQEHLKEMRDAADQLQKANSIKNDFLARMSHDLRTPMNAIIGLTDLAAEETDNSKAMQTYVEKVGSAANFLLGLVNDCLDLDKMTSGQMQLNPVPYTYEQFRKSIFSIVSPLCDEKQITFSMTEPKDPYTVRMDPVRFEQIFINLLTNAVKYTPEKGKIDFLIEHRIRKDDAVSMDFIIRDNGIGMSEEFQKKMYEPFEQENSGAGAQIQGTGLGLTIVKNIVDMMKGTIKVKSAKGKGTEFKVHLSMPILSMNNTAPVQISLAIDDQILKDTHILLVEDHPLNTEIARRLLEKKSVHVVCAENGRRGLEIFEQSAEYEFDAVLMDIRMPVMDGLEAAAAIRALNRKDAGSVPIIAMTANAFEEDINRSKKAGMNEHLSKPIDPEILYKTLEKWIAESRSQRSEAE